MSGLKCPFCNNEIRGTETVCSKCGHNLIIQCPYCKQSISAFEEVCPCCTTRLKKIHYDFKTLIFRIGIAFSSLWLIMMLGVTYLYAKYPTLLLYENKKGDTAIDAYFQLCYKVLCVVFVPYIISLVKKFRVRESIVALVINLLFAFGFTVYILHLSSAARVH
jgi:hypothetical protein